MKKILCIVLSVVMCMGTAGFAAASEAERDDYGYNGTVNKDELKDKTVNLFSGSEVLDGELIRHSDGTVIQISGSSEAVIRNSYIEGTSEKKTAPLEGNPGNLLVAGDVRTTLVTGRGQAYYINSSVVSKNWAALSTDAASPADEGQKPLNLSAYGTMAKVLEGGYGAYSDILCDLSLYGSCISAAEIGIISGTYGSVAVGTIEDGENSKILGPVLTEGDKQAHEDKETASVIEGGRNALMIHSVNLPPYWEFEGYSEEELPKYSTEIRVHGSTLMTDMSLDGGIEYEPQKQAYIEHTRGSVILIKSTNAEIDIDDSKLIPDEKGTGYLIQTVYNNDMMFMNAVPDGEEYPGVNVTVVDSELKGDIAHEDYQRDMTITLDGTTLDGAVNEYDLAHWKKAAEDEGFEEFCADESYDAHHGIEVLLKNGSVWTVTGESRISDLIIGEGCTVNGIMYVDDVKTEADAGEYHGKIILTPGEGKKEQPTEKETTTEEETTTEHVHNWVRDDGGYPADCIYNGCIPYICTTCGAEYQEIIPAMGHDFVYVYTSLPTCVDEGYYVYRCTRCGDETTGEVLPPYGHEWVYEGHEYANCTTDEYYIYYCSKCGEIMYEYTGEKAFGHNHNGLMPDYAEGLEDLYHVDYCTNCGYVFLETREPHIVIPCSCGYDPEGVHSEGE